jgi:hypothetical protein
MAEAGHAHAIMGNHELNAVLFHTRHPDAQGEPAPLRAHSASHMRQHRAFLAEAEQDGEAAQRHIAWMKTLPVCLDLGGLRAVHALWDEQALASLRGAGLLDESNRLHPDRWHELAEKYTPGCDAVERLTKGIEVDLPHGLAYHDSYGTRRTLARLKWWAAPERTGLTLADVVLGTGDLPPERLASYPAPDALREQIRALQRGDGGPVFFGHYWQRGALPAVETTRAICLDQSIAGGGYLAAATVALRDGRVVGMGYVAVPARRTVYAGGDHTYAARNHRTLYCTLYGWITDVTRKPDGEISFCSGGDHEWYAIIAPADADALRQALLRSLPDAPDTADLFDLIDRKFIMPESDECPFDSIKAFLDREGVPWRSDFWY